MKASEDGETKFGVTQVGELNHFFFLAKMVGLTDVKYKSRKHQAVGEVRRRHSEKRDQKDKFCYPHTFHLGLSKKYNNYTKIQ